MCVCVGGVSGPCTHSKLVSPRKHLTGSKTVHFIPRWQEIQKGTCIHSLQLFAGPKKKKGLCVCPCPSHHSHTQTHTQSSSFLGGPCWGGDPISEVLSSAALCETDPLPTTCEGTGGVGGESSQLFAHRVDLAFQRFEDALSRGSVLSVGPLSLGAFRWGIVCTPSFTAGRVLGCRMVPTLETELRLR